MEENYDGQFVMTNKGRRYVLSDYETQCIRECFENLNIIKVRVNDELDKLCPIMEAINDPERMKIEDRIKRLENIVDREKSRKKA